MINSLLPGMLVAVCMKKLCLYLQIYSFLQNLKMLSMQVFNQIYQSKKSMYVVKFLSTIITCLRQQFKLYEQLQKVSKHYSPLI